MFTESKNILILGGYGSAGSIISELLINLTQHRIIIAGRNLDRATDLSNSLNIKYNTDRSSARKIDAKENIDLNNIDAIILSSPVIEHIEKIIDSAEKTNCKVFDITPPTNEKYKKFPLETKNLYVTDLGGMFPLAMIKYINLENLLSANIYNFYEINWDNIIHSKETVPEFEKTIKDNLKNQSLYIKNRWYSIEEIPLVQKEIDSRLIEFKTAWTKELLLIKENYPSITDIGFFYKINEYPIIKEKSILKAELKNNYKKISMYVKCDSGYFLTAAGTTVAIMQCFEDDSIKGVYTSGEYLNPTFFFKTLKEKMNIEILIENE